MFAMRLSAAIATQVSGKEYSLAGATAGTAGTPGATVTELAALSLGARGSCEPSLVRSTTSAPSSRGARMLGLGLPLRTLSGSSLTSSVSS
jgi:hypothetical protein